MSDSYICVNKAASLGVSNGDEPRGEVVDKFGSYLYSPKCRMHARYIHRVVELLVNGAVNPESFRKGTEIFRTNQGNDSLWHFGRLRYMRNELVLLTSDELRNFSTTQM